MTAAPYQAGASYSAALFAGKWNPVPGRFRVALYKGNYADSPVIYSPALAYEHRTLKAAARRLLAFCAHSSPIAARV